MAETTDIYKDIVVRVLDVKRYYGSGEAVTKALDGISLDIYRGEYLSIMGPSGSGKSTLFNMIGGIDSPTEGMVFMDEIDLAQLDSYELAWMRCHKIGYIFQSYNILPVLTALEKMSHVEGLAHTGVRISFSRMNDSKNDPIKVAEALVNGIKRLGEFSTAQRIVKYDAL